MGAISIEQRRRNRIDAAKRDALHSGLQISASLRAAITSGDADLIACAIGREIRIGAPLPAAIVAGYNYLCNVGTMSVCEAFARDVKDILVNVGSANEEARHVQGS